MPGPKCLERDSSGKNDWLACYQCVFHQTEANLAAIQHQNHQNVKTNQFWQKVPGFNGLIRCLLYGKQEKFNLRHFACEWPKFAHPL